VGSQKLAAGLAKYLKGGDLIELASDLGGGKTTFVQGLARGLGYHGPVTSPTFALSQIYRLAPSLELHHYDLYRLGHTGVVGDELVEDLQDPQVITVIEWADIAEADLPLDRLKIEFEVVSNTERRLRIRAGGPRSKEILEKLLHGQEGQK
jgi:tRNA threonylcarbamoyladenosine biosynthesis protein TsaE